jgi:eukaryotic-like serine/threonine-protein kinase
MGLGRESSNANDSASVSLQFGLAAGVSNHLASGIEPNSSLVAQCAPSLPCKLPASKNSNSQRSLLSEFTSAWDQGLGLPVDTFLARLDPADFRGAVELIYREFCLVEAAGKEPEVAEYLCRFPRHAEALERLLGLHDACSPSLLQHWVKSAPVAENLPSAGNEVGPYFLRRELGRGTFARVFLAEQINLENRLVVVKVATRLTREPWLLARVRHPHIVEVVSHAIVEDCGFHLICMPFLGGATLSAVLAERRRSRPGILKGDFLANLDAVAAPEFPASQAAHPAREILASLTYDQAIVWIGARLAEALDHAFSKEVAHGDVKPSNILLAADGSPMLLDFNLARDGSPVGFSDSAGDPGGTLAYMAPERLWALAAAAPARAQIAAPSKIASDFASTPVFQSSSVRGETPPNCRAHQADIYSLGVVLLEALAHGASGASNIRPAMPSYARSSSLESAAKMYAKARTRSARVLIDEATSGRTIPAGLRAILEHALDPAPSGRYQRAANFAEDLDRWRSNRPLAFAAEPLWRYTIPSWIKRRKRILFVAAAAFSLVLGLPTTALLILNARRTQEEIARNKLNRHWGDAEAYRFRPMTSDWLGDPFRSPASFRLTDPGDPEALDSARHALEDFGVLGAGDWRRSESFGHLPRAEREDLELWLMEQAYRYCLALAERPDSRNDWERARNLLVHLVEANPLEVFTALADRINAKLDPVGSTTARSHGSEIRSDPKVGLATHSARTWLSEYLLGVAAKCEFELSEDHTLQSPDIPLDPDSAPMEPSMRGRQSAAKALEHFRKLLAIRPESYWGNYRAAGVCYVLGAFAESAQHLDRCLAIRPDNAAIRGQRAACLAWLERYSEALEECDRALVRDPDLPELYRTRAFIRAASGLTDGLAADVQHFELLRRLIPREFLDPASRTEPTEPELSATEMLDTLGEFSNGVGLLGTLANRPSLANSEAHVLAVDPGELNKRLMLASKIHNAGDRELASIEYAKVLMLDPDHIPARTIRALDEIKNKRFDEAHHDLELVLSHPHLMEYLRRNPPFWHFLLQASRQLSSAGRAEEGRAVARKVLDFANALHHLRSESHYNLASAYAVSARTDPQFVPLAANELWWAFVAHPVYQDHYLRDPTFDLVRAQVDHEFHAKPDPSEEHQRLLAARAVQPK